MFLSSKVLSHRGCSSVGLRLYESQTRRGEREDKRSSCIKKYSVDS
jgi:hypothetical protein